MHNRLHAYQRQMNLRINRDDIRLFAFVFFASLYQRFSNALIGHPRSTLSRLLMISFVLGYITFSWNLIRLGLQVRDYWMNLELRFRMMKIK